MKMFALVQMSGGSPTIDQSVTPYTGFVLCDKVGNWGAYLISGTGAQLVAINALPQVVGICQVSETENSKWPELDSPINSGVRTTLNTWITNNHSNWPQIPAGATNRQLIGALYKKFNLSFDINGIDISDGS